jgi:phenylacetate-CoA ligase
MRFDFSSIPLRNRAFSEKPMTFIDQDPKNFLASIIDLVAIETGNRAAREYWQQKQLQNLLRHAAQRSAFWRKRVGNNLASDFRLSRLPVLTRSEVLNQVDAEGPLLAPSDGLQTIKRATSGSSGTPVHFFVSEMNVAYSAVRSDAQHFMEGRDLALNSTRLRPEPLSNKKGFTVKKNEPGTLGSFIRTGNVKSIEYFHPDMEALREELERDSIGYLVAHPHLIETMLQDVDAGFFKRAGTAMFTPIASELAADLRQVFSDIGIPVRATYSSEEVGFIGMECEKIAGCYHVATSNVIVEVVEDDSIRVDGVEGGRVLVTDLHSYATPFVRYDLGDFATLGPSCRCGHDGPVLSNVYGRGKRLLKHADGRVSIFHPRGKDLAAIAKFDEYRIRQTDVKNIVVEIGRSDSLTPEQTMAFISLIKQHAGDGFDVTVKAVAQIDWGHSIKRLGYRSDVL